MLKALIPYPWLGEARVGVRQRLPAIFPPVG